jgi:electron transfer flavoprotein beta subunit
MKIAVPLKQVPDLVEDLEVAASGTALDFDGLKMKLNEFDEHALEEALLLKEASGAEVVALAIAGAEADRMLFTALAKGADKAVKVSGVDANADNHALAQAFAAAIGPLGADLILTGVQSAADRDGQLAPLLAARLGLPCVSVVTGVQPQGKAVLLKKEYSGGVMAEFEADLPVVLGIQAARQTPRYAPVSKVRQVQQSAKLEDFAASGGAAPSQVVKMAPPPRGQGCKMLKSADELLAVLKEKGVV